MENGTFAPHLLLICSIFHKILKNLTFYFKKAYGHFKRVQRRLYGVKGYACINCTGTNMDIAWTGPYVDSPYDCMCQDMKF